MNNEKCCQAVCDKDAKFRAFWPGKPPQPFCEECILKAQGIAEAIGMYLHVEPLAVPEKSDGK